MVKNHYIIEISFLYLIIIIIMSCQNCGYITTSKAFRIINQLSRKNSKTDDIKRSINRTPTRSGHGSIFLGLSSSMINGHNNIIILVGTQVTSNVLSIGIFDDRSQRCYNSRSEWQLTHISIQWKLLLLYF